jgi:hypothetical protein
VSVTMFPAFIQCTLYSLCTHCALTVHSLSTHYPLTVHSLSTHYPLTVHSLSTHYPLTIHSVYTQYALYTKYTLTLHSVNTTVRITSNVLQHIINPLYASSHCIHYTHHLTISKVLSHVRTCKRRGGSTGEMMRIL